MKPFIVLIIALALIVYHIKNTDYGLTIYLLQILGAVLLFNLTRRYKKRKERDSID